jgi:peptide/nickel transport system substrate-binding protein
MQDQFGRRAFLGGASALAAAGLLDHVPGFEPRAAHAQAPARAGTLKIALLGLDTSDPHRHTGSISCQQIYVEGLTSIAGDGKAIPYLAESWTVSPDGKRYVFRIRAGVKFHNGREMTAADVLANATRVRDLRRGWLAAPMQLVAALEAPDARTFVMEMKEPYGPLLNILSELWILAPESPGWAATIQTPIGTGPFSFGQWVPNEKLLSPAHREYWQPGLPKVAAVEFNLRDTVDYSLALRAGDLHVARAPADQMAVLKADPNIEIQFMKDTSWIFWSFNNRRPRAPFDNVKVREAISYAMDKAALLKIWAGEAGVPTNQMAAPGNFFWDEALHKADAHAKPDRAKALAMLAAEGVVPARTPLRIVSWQNDYSQACAQTMRELGFQVEHLALDDIGAQRRLAQLDWDLAPFGSGPRADIFLRFVRLMSDGPNTGLWGSPQDAAFDETVKKAVAAVDLDRRRAHYLDAWRHAMARYWTVVIGHSAEAIANRRDATGWSPGFTWGAARVDGGAAHTSLVRAS